MSTAAASNLNDDPTDGQQLRGNLVLIPNSSTKLINPSADHRLHVHPLPIFSALALRNAARFLPIDIAAAKQGFVRCPAAAVLTDTDPSL